MEEKEANQFKPPARDYSGERVKKLVSEAIILTCTNEREEDVDVQRLWAIISELNGQIAYREGKIESLERQLNIYRPRSSDQ